MAKKKLSKQEESLFDADTLEHPQEQNAGPINLSEIRETVEKDLAELGDMTDTTKEEIDIKEVEQLGASALPGEVQIAEVEDLRSQETMTDEELKRIEGIVGTNSVSRRQAEAIVLGEQRAANLNGEELPKPTAPAKKEEKSSHPGSNPYKGSGKGPKHPAKISPRVRTSGDANSGDPHLR